MWRNIYEQQVNKLQKKKKKKSFFFLNNFKSENSFPL